MTRQSIQITDELLDYIHTSNPPEHEVLTKCRLETANHVRSNMQISPEQGAFMSFMIRLIDARLAVEVGVFTGYSALATILALQKNAGPGAKLFALDVSHTYLDTAKQYWAEAKVDDLIETRIAPAKDSLQALIDEGYKGKIDFIFIDADKKGYLDYLPLGKILLRNGGLMLFDNVLRNGLVVDENTQDEAALAMRELKLLASADDGLEVCMLGIGDGILMARKLK